MDNRLCGLQTDVQTDNIQINSCNIHLKCLLRSSLDKATPKCLELLHKKPKIAVTTLDAGILNNVCLVRKEQNKGKKKLQHPLTSHQEIVTCF